MFFGMCIYETLSDDGRLDSFIISPTNDGVLLTDHRRDVGLSVDDSVDIGPLRFYADADGLNVRSVRSVLSKPNFFGRTRNGFQFRIDHFNWPLRTSHAGYYILLLPQGYSGIATFERVSATASGQITSLPKREKCNITFLTDTKQMLVHETVYPDQPSLRVRGQIDPRSSLPKRTVMSTATEVFSGDLPGVHYKPVSNLLRAINRGLSTESASAFICHSSADKPDARRLAIELARRGVRPWLDEAEIRIGDSLIEKIETGIASSTCLVPMLSTNSVTSRWCQEELRMAIATQIKSGVKGVLPALLNDCNIPGFLVDKAYADLRKPDAYDKAVDTLAADIRHAGSRG